MSVSIGVVADIRRGDMGVRLARFVDADYLSIDSQAQGCTWNHSGMWQTHADNPADWNVVLEDDAVPVDGFRDQLDAALQVAPTSIASLYLGCGYIDDRYTEIVLARADRIDAHWIVAQGRILHAVALAVRGDLLPSLVGSLPPKTRPIDQALSRWARRDGHQVAYSNPSLVDHADDQSLVVKYRRKERRAWRTGAREAWCDKMMLM